MVSGIVVSSVDGTALPYCSVVKKGDLSVATTTATDGTWQLDVPTGITLVITATGGYYDAEITAEQNNRTVLQKKPATNTPH